MSCAPRISRSSPPTTWATPAASTPAQRCRAANSSSARIAICIASGRGSDAARCGVVKATGVVLAVNPDFTTLAANVMGAQPAAQVEDRASTIRIKGLRAFWVNPIVFVRIETTHGIVGWGDIKAVEPRAAKALVESLYSLLDGENPTRIEHLWQKLYR